MTCIRPTRSSAAIAAAFCCLLALAATPAGAAGYAASTQLTPYKLMSDKGLCLTAIGTLDQATADLRLSMEACEPAHTQQSFYVLDAMADADAGPASGAPSVRIALVKGFDRLPRASYNLLRKASAPAGAVVLTADSVAGAPPAVTFTMSTIQGRQDAWVPVGDPQTGSIPVAGKRLLRYGPLKDGSHALRKVDGATLASAGSCTPAFFSVPPDNQGGSCSLDDLVPHTTPMTVQLRDAANGQCVARATHGPQSEVVLRSCSLGSLQIRWSLVPTAYLD